MKNCTDCAYAKWQRTKNGRLHPSGDGWCTYDIKMPQLPASMFYVSKPSIGGGTINRKEDLREHCPYYMKKDM